MDTKYLKYVLTIARKKNMTKAAEELYVSQSSLSQYLSRLEQEIGVQLFIRAKGELLLMDTDKLQQLIVQKRELLAARKVNQIQKDLYHNIRGLNHKGHITIGVTSQFGLRMLTEIIPAYKKVFPQVTIEITESNVPTLTRMILEEGIDCAVMALNCADAFAEEQVSLLRKEEVLFAVPAAHGYCLRNRTGIMTREELIHEFKDENFMLSKKGSTLRELADRIFASAGFQPSTMCETNSIIATRAMVAKGIGVTFIARSCVSDRENVAYYSLNPRMYRYNALVRRKNLIQNEPERALFQHIRGYFERQDEDGPAD